MQKFLVFISCLLISVNSVFAQQLEPRREFRGAWVHTVGNGEYRKMTSEQMKQHFIDLLDEFERAKINAVIFQVRPQADALYTNSIEPWSRFITGTQGVAPTPLWDPLEFMVEECHKRGMELHAWFNPYRVTSNDKEELTPDHLYFKKPHMFVTYGKQIYFDPGEPESREHTLKVIKDVVSRYDIDAVHFDDYFYPYKLYDKGKLIEFPDEKSFAKYGEKDGFSKEQRNDWRRNNVNILVRDLGVMIKSVKPWVKFGISPFGIWRDKRYDPTGSNTLGGCANYDDLYADIKLWVEKQWIDYNVPQLYWEIGHPKADYETLIEWWSENNYNENLYIGQSISKTVKVPLKEDKEKFENQLPRKMELVRKNPKVHGNVWWPGYSIPRNPDGFTDSLISKYQTKIALIPQYKHIDTIAPEPVEDLALMRGKNGNFIHWNGAKTDDEMQRPVYYCVYLFNHNELIVPDEGIRKSPIAITRDNKFEIPAFEDGRGKGRVRTYAVTALDRMQNESEAKYITIYRENLEQ